MARLRIRGVVQVTLLLVICMVSVAIGVKLRSSKANPLLQEGEKIIDVKPFPNNPVEIKELSVNKVKFQPGQKISVKAISDGKGKSIDDWIENLEFTVRNNWKKEIIFMKIDLDFPETVGRGKLMAGKLDIGIHPLAKGNDRQYGKPISIAPGDTFTYTMPEDRLAVTRKISGTRRIPAR